jgi:hypothetical protein
VLVLRPEPGPGEAGVRVVLDVRRIDLPAVDARYLGDRTNGLLHLVRRAPRGVRADARLSRGETLVLPAGTLPDGRPLEISVRVAEPERPR